MENIDKAIEILQAFKEGKTIEYLTEFEDGRNEWRKIDTLINLTGCIHKSYQLRVTKEPIYRPYADAKEFLEDEEKNGGWITGPIDGSKTSKTHKLVYIDEKQIVFGGCSLSPINFKILFEKYIWKKTGKPCGIIITE